MRKTMLTIMLVLGLSFGILTVTEAATLKPVETNNVSDKYYYYNWDEVINSYLVDNGDNTFSRIEYTNNKVCIEKYSAEGKILSSASVNRELTLFGGFYSGAEYNFLVFGQENPNESEDRTVVRVVKYSKDWKRLSAVNLKGANTTIPFEAGSLRMAEYGDMLYIRTAHEMYASADGLNHQANLTIVVNTSTMKITEHHSRVWNISTGYVSHSFNQFIRIDDDDVVAVDHGDAYPRSVVLIRYNGAAGKTSISGSVQNVDAFPIQGNIGANYTGVKVGGFEASDSSYLIAGSSVKQDDAWNTNTIDNLFVTVTDKASFSEESTKIKWMTSYTQDNDIAPPQLVKINGNKFLLMWTKNKQLKYVFLDGKGNKTSEIYSSNTVANLSDCQPILFNNQVTWYYTDGSVPVFCFINLNAPGSVKVIAEHNYSDSDWDKTLVTPATFTKDGVAKTKCIRCGSEKKITIPRVKTPVLTVKNYTYNGSVRNPQVTVKDRTGKVLEEYYDYYESWEGGRKDVGRYGVYVYLTGFYEGTKTVYLTIHSKAPKTFSAKLYGYNDVKLSWSKCTGADGYRIYYKKASQSDDQYVLLKSTTKTAYSKENLTGGTRYTFKVVPYFTDGSKKINSINSRTYTLWTLKKISVPKVEKYSSGKVKISWTNISGETGYQISRSTSKTGTDIVGTYKSETLKSKILSPAKNKTYYYKVRAYKLVGDKKIYGPWSDVMAFKLK